MVWKCVHGTHVCATWRGGMCVHEHTWEHGTECERTQGFCALIPKRVHMGFGHGSNSGQGWVCMIGMGQDSQSLCVHGWWYDSCPWDRHTSYMSAVVRPPGQRRATGGQSQEKEELNCDLSLQFQLQAVGAFKVLAGPSGAANYKHRRFSCPETQLPSGSQERVSTWRRVLRAVGHLAVLPDSRPRNVETDSFTCQGPHPRSAKASQQCMGHVGELVIPVPTNCVHMQYAAEWVQGYTGRHRCPHLCMGRQPVGASRVCSFHIS